LFRHLESLTWTFHAEGSPVDAIYVYSEPHETRHGIEYRPRAAAESGVEGLACLDDVARAVTLAAQAYEHTGDPHHADLARRWLSFVYYMQHADGRFTNFVLDRRGTRNDAGQTSFPGGPWWTVRALQALATAYRVFGDERALAALTRCPIPDAEHPGEQKTRALLALAGIELLRADVHGSLRALWRRRVRRWCDAMVEAADGLLYVPDERGERRVALWGYHQLQALAAASSMLDEPAYCAAADRTVTHLIQPVLAANFLYEYPDHKADQCAYCVSPMVQGLAELYRVSGQPRYQSLALRSAEWFAGGNDAGAVMYEAESGRCLDGLSGNQVSRNCGAESAIEAGFAELERRTLLRAARGTAEMVS
jgi:hypothetical protein